MEEIKEEFVPMALEFCQCNEVLPSCVIVDIDGTIAEKNGRHPFMWKEVGNDLPRKEIIKLVMQLQDNVGYNIVICTGRDAVCEPETKAWLLKYGIHYEDFYMRANKDQRPDWQVKEEMWREICQKYKIEFMLDDRKQVIDHARKHGFTVLDVAGNTF